MNNTEIKAGTIFGFKRPSGLAGAPCNRKISHIDTDISKLNLRGGLGNYDITRNNFVSSDIKPRMAGDFDKLQAIDIETQGAKIQLSDKTIEELFKTRIGDKTDIQWTNERTRLITMYKLRGMNDDDIARELEVNKPLGREQRTISSKQNIGQSSLTVADKLQEIKQEVVEGRAESRTQQALLIGQLALLLTNIQTIDSFTTMQLTDLSQTIMRMNVPRDHKQIGLLPRYVDNMYYNANQGLIHLFLISSALSDKNYGTDSKTNITLTTPVYNFAKSSFGLPTIQLSTMIKSVALSDKTQKRYIDLQERGVISYPQLTGIVSGLKGSFDNPECSIDPSNR